MSKYKTILRHLTTYSVGIVIGKLASVILLPIYTRYLTPADYGVLELLEITSSVIATLVALKLSDAFFFFDSQAETAIAKRTVLMTGYFGATVAGILVAAAAWWWSPELSRIVLNTDRYTPGFQLVAISLAMTFVQEIGFAHLRALNKSQLFLGLQLARLVVQAASSVIFLVAFHRGYLGVQMGAVAGSLTSCVVFLPYALVKQRAPVDFALLRRMFRYSAPLGVSGVAMLIVHFGDRWFLQRFASLSILGVYSLAYKVAMVVAYAQLAFVTYWNAQMFSLLKDRKGDALYVRLCTYFILVLASAAVVVTALARPGILLLTPASFHPAIVFIPILAGAYVVRGMADFVRSPLLVENHSVLNARAVIWTSLVCLILYATLIPAYKAWGAVAATALSFVAMLILSFWEAQRIRRFSFEYGRLLKIAISGSTSLAILMINPGTLVPQIALSLLGMAVFAAGLVFTGFFQPDEKHLVFHAWQTARGWIFNSARSTT
jgi:O-antigen/teichoic acid export membrane protein